MLAYMYLFQKLSFCDCAGAVSCLEAGGALMLYVCMFVCSQGGAALRLRLGATPGCVNPSGFANALRVACVPRLSTHSTV